MDILYLSIPLFFSDILKINGMFRPANNKLSLKHISIVNDSLLKLSCVDKVY